ncbi:MAG: 4Fe-4S binding protein, partial [Bryobacteraceae bacterium]
MAEWRHLNLHYKIVARIDPGKCIGCELCYTACWDGAHQCIHLDREPGSGNGHATPEQVVAASLARHTSTPTAAAVDSSA